MSSKYSEMQNAYRREFAKRLRVIISSKGTSARQVALRMGINLTSMYSYVNGERMPSAFTVAKMCLVLDCDANQLLGVRRNG